MPTDAEISNVLAECHLGHITFPDAVAKLRALFAGSEPERMSVRLEILRDLAVAVLRREHGASVKVGDLLEIADGMIEAAAKEPRNG